jgi:hypothetical protein
MSDIHKFNHAEHYDDESDSFVSFNFKEGFELKLLLWMTIIGVLVTLLALIVTVLAYLIQIVKSLI